ncbi:HAMP domain-containing sensor histidine kinase [Siphonobacter sp. SORGH_AS_0500]|uniref:sensor histidine kinase n=1 Tax=Siphonobacter sp. SORGH_AS_0500 TaxID=1864824 RepID=UPI002855FC48|nr:HAMP domain-containing sensor histidine kinase [Siphonobacter sp. SORGH_AS_0500]MDR6196751.1 two-component system phosphate regulon sensor histidine kinase PhoR [Siphonobacter sp. SORGH_AS_0500]
MSSRTLRIFTVLSVLLLLGLALVQFYWFRQAYQLEDRDFDQRVTSALRIVCRRMIDYNNRPNSLPLRPVERVSANYYTVQINDQMDPSALEVFLKQEFSRHDLKANFEYGIYDCEQHQIQYGGFVCHTANCDEQKAIKTSFPKVAGQNYYFGVYFPEKRNYVFDQLKSWTISSVGILLVILFFSYALYVIFKQKRLSELQTDFVNNLTHEFKTPLSTILISTDVLSKPNQSSERLASYAGIIRKEALRLKQQVDTVLQTAQSNQQKLQLENLDIHEVIKDLVDRFQPRIQEEHIHITLELKAQPSIIQADLMHLTNALYNLLDNAIKYSSQHPEISIRTEVIKQRVRIDIQDWGIGISKEHQSRIFHKFFRVPTGNVHNVKGFGLGLYYVKTITEAMGGQVTMESVEGQGSCFTLIYPVLN